MLRFAHLGPEFSSLGRSVAGHLLSVCQCRWFFVWRPLVCEAVGPTLFPAQGCFQMAHDMRVVPGQSLGTLVPVLGGFCPQMGTRSQPGDSESAG